MTHRRRSEGDGWKGSLKGVEWEWECIYIVLHSPLKFSMYLVPPFVCPKGSYLFFSFFLCLALLKETYSLFVFTFKLCKKVLCYPICSCMYFQKWLT